MPVLFKATPINGQNTFLAEAGKLSVLGHSRPNWAVRAMSAYHRPRGAGASLHALAELAAELSQRPAFRHADSRHLSRNIEPIAKSASTFAGHFNDFNVRPGTGAIASARP